ncbi:hypothetical protein [Sediminibacterium sp. TEGAF015]|uniref:hypothetical protein n=1 Tax=Sediminibacterium sp. TEGAF015 TaxID=575378 RepID=UPI002201871A|nr:hypothetical protein [Sediminibacterium sp. TEGAF015]BDQ12065.1 hypothetical protein TEGAF0_12820 [Sediminibacterium sp. TEGAF015]
MALNKIRELFRKQPPLKALALSFILNWFFWLIMRLLADQFVFDEKHSWMSNLFYATWMSFIMIIPFNWKTIQKLFKTKTKETKNMEVHHHAHDPAAPHHKKNWKSYFWEFLMLFLAVFCGFLAEYQLEHKIERDREIQYVESLVQNLKADTSDLTRTINRNYQKEAAWTSLLALARKDISNPVIARQFYEYFFKGAFLPVFRSTDATVIQLKNAGNLRLIRRKEVVDSILGYDSRNRAIADHNESFSKQNDKVWDEAFPIIQTWIFADSSYVDFEKREILSNVLPELNNNKLQNQIFFGNLTRSILYTKVNRNYLIQQKAKAESLISFLQTKYHLE